MKDEERGPTTPPPALPDHVAEPERAARPPSTRTAGQTADEAVEEAPATSLSQRLAADFFEPPSSARVRTSTSAAAESPLPDSGLAPLSLTLIEPPKLLYERAREPSDDSPILYRERAYLVDNLQSDEELEEQLETALATLQEDLRDRDTSQFIQLAFFDHEFEDEPVAPPIATLSWKDWQGRAEIWVRGIRRSSAPPTSTNEEAMVQGELEDAERALHDAAADADPVLDGPSSGLIDQGASTRAADTAPRSDSGLSWQAPSRSGEYPIPEVETGTPEPERNSERVLASEELLSALFERMHELLYLETIADGADYIKYILTEFIPCDGALIHVFDIDAREFVVVRAIGPHSRDVVARRSSGGAQLAEALRRQVSIRISPPEVPPADASWQALGVVPVHYVCSPVHHSGRYLGAIELVRSAGGETWTEAQLHALEYVCEQFADFVADRPLFLGADSIAPPPA